MKSGAALAASMIALATTLGSCSTPHLLMLINGTGADVVLRVANEDSSDLPPRDLVVTLKPGASRTILEGKAAVRGVRLSTPRCSYRFDLPNLDVYVWATEDRKRNPGAPERTYPIHIQVGSDFMIYLAKQDQRRPLAPSELLGLQGHGFPLRPASVTCR